MKDEIAILAEDREHGASELARRSLALLANRAQTSPATSCGGLITELNLIANRLRQTRPSMAPVQNLVGRWQSLLVCLPQEEVASLRPKIVALAQQLQDQSQQAVTAIARQTAALVGRSATVMTHSLSSTVVASFKILKEQGVNAVVTESRPLQEGYRLARQLSAWGIATTLITDAQMGLFVGKAKAIVVGADTLLNDGSVINKAGTLLLALAARRQNIPFYVASETFKRVSASPAQAHLEEKGPEELALEPQPGITLRNIYFDITPPDLISAYITEQGVYRQASELPFFTI
ncbi:initiation factor 2B related protein [Nitrosococcus halophilus Nc 4]|uniref:Initiation factor 2B related protein n=1 Tax=Nitrosococcus halophilus (strain Nc4) TaxID=472759 RepID=D5C579_NITHN|nr:initiation factor 2B-like protein [Nitrosococcus halophilus]ADE15302.1 initiation factor 2B related protein [Nitrosococcus halophilus Nc 4]